MVNKELLAETVTKYTVLYDKGQILKIEVKSYQHREILRELWSYQMV